MAIPNSFIAEQFSLLADLLEIQGANPFRVRAYRNAARVVESWPAPIAAIFGRQEDLPRIPGIGKDLAGKIREVALTGKLPLLDEVVRKLPRGVAELLRIPGLGPKRVLTLIERLRIHSLGELQKAAENQKLRELAGFGEKTEARILQTLERFRTAGAPRYRLSIARQSAEPLIGYLRAHPAVEQALIAGSYRRQTETVGDLDILVIARKTSARELMRYFRTYDEVTEVLASGPTRSTVRLRSGIQVDLRVVPKASYGAALHYFTGSKAHNIAVRALGVRRGLKINEYGIYRGPKKIAGAFEEDVFREVGLPWIPPEIRENRGEIEAAAKNRLPRLIRLEDLRGDLHAHTDETDGRASLRAMAHQAQRNGLEYLGITDHSQRLAMTFGLTPRRLLEQLEKIDELNKTLKGFRILKSIEVDILENGQLDLPDSVLSRLDYTVCSIHSKFDLPVREQTERVLRAMENPYFTILGHPTGRLIPDRPAYPLDLEKILAAARDRGCCLEVNSQPERLDLMAAHCRLAKDYGVPVVISTDAHSARELSLLEYGVSQARRGWLEAEEVLNTLPLEKLLAAFAQRRTPLVKHRIRSRGARIA